MSWPVVAPRSPSSHKEVDKRVRVRLREKKWLTLRLLAQVLTHYPFLCESRTMHNRQIIRRSARERKLILLREREGWFAGKVKRIAATHHIAAKAASQLSLDSSR